MLNKLKRSLFNALLKLIDEAVSAKIHLIGLATFALFYGKIGGTEWVSVVTALGLGRVLIESIVASKSNVQPKENPNQPD